CGLPEIECTQRIAVIHVHPISTGAPFLRAISARAARLRERTTFVSGQASATRLGSSGKGLALRLGRTSRWAVNWRRGGKVRDVYDNVVGDCHDTPLPSCRISHLSGSRL